MTPENCPSCGKELIELEDFPRIEVKSVEILSLPEKILHWSSERAKSIGSHRFDPESIQEVNLSGQIKEILNSDPVQEYFNSLVKKVGSEVETKEIVPPFEESSYFKGAFSIPNSNYFLSIRNEEEKEDIAKIILLGYGPNMGSAGSPTLTKYTDLARIRFKGKLLRATAPV